jgi:hypothetical protein
LVITQDKIEDPFWVVKMDKNLSDFGVKLDKTWGFCSEYPMFGFHKIKRWLFDSCTS